MKRILGFFLFLLTLSSVAASAEEVFFYHVDAVGTPLAMTNASGQKVWEADCKPFGEEYTITNSIEPNDRRFVGKEKDEETGLNYFGARYLSAGTGRFLAPDPVRAVDGYSGKINPTILKNPQRLNLYSYSVNNPYRYVDPDGQIPIDTIWDVGNIIYDIATGDAGALAVDVAALAIPYVPAGISKLQRISKGADGFIDLTTAEKRAHILDGDSTGGGHRFGAGRPGKSEFPKDWSDDRIIHEISEIATDPRQKWSPPGSNGYITTSKNVDGVDIRVVFDQNKSKIVSGYPTNTGKNPK